MKDKETNELKSLLSYIDNIPKVLEKERKKQFTKSELKEVQRLLRDFGVDKASIDAVSEGISTMGQLQRRKWLLITEKLEEYRA